MANRVNADVEEGSNYELLWSAVSEKLGITDLSSLMNWMRQNSPSIMM
ncbi:hypothetical protein [Methanococcoides burtonii]|nr:hypothetical protein [Methanococcoides burtonii]